MSVRHARRRPAAIGLGFVLAASGAAWAAPGCDQPSAFYEREAYVVRQVALGSPFDFIRPIRQSLEAAATELPVRPGQAYTGAAVTEAATRLHELPGGWAADGVSPIRLSAVTAAIEDCRVDGEAKTLVVRFRIFGSRIPLRYTRLFGTPAGGGLGTADAAGFGGLGAVKIVPTVAYTRADRLSGGVAVDARKLGPIEALAARASASSRSHLADIAASGSRPFDRIGLRALDWQVAYRDSEVPVEGGSRASRALDAHVTALVADAPGGMLLRAGAAVARGRLAGDPTAVPLAPGTVAAADVTSLRGFASAQWRRARQSASLAYGIDASATGNGFGDGFTRQVVDGSWRLRLLPIEHKPVDLEARLAAGWIGNHGELPFAARFFGGNTVEEFLPGANLGLRANPVIRSFSRSELDRVTDDGPLGAERFVALNLTVAPTIWGRPLVPRELRETPGFDEQVTSGLTAAESQLEQHYAAASPGFAAFVATRTDGIRSALAPAIEALAAKFEALASRAPERQEACATSIDTVSLSMDDIAPGDAGRVLALFRALSLPGRTLDEVLACVVDPDFAPDDAVSTAALGAVREAKARMRQGLALTDDRQAAAQAQATLAPARRVLDSFLHELNVTSIAPVVLFDAAQLGPQPADGAGFRFGVGGGLRVSLADSLHLTAVYAWNPHPRPHERGGALTVTLDVSAFLF